MQSKGSFAERHTNMARRGNGGNANTYTPSMFVNIRLDAAQLEAFEVWASDANSDHQGVINDACVTGWKFSVRYDTDNHCAISSATLWAPGSPNHNVCVVSRGPDVETALWMGAYKVMVLYANEDLRTLSAANNYG